MSKEQQATVLRARVFFRDLRQEKDRLTISRLIGKAFADSGYDAAVQFEYLGDRKLANLWKLVETARSFDQSGLYGLPEFIAQLNELVNEQPREEQAATLPEDAEVIKLMTIHQAKGLEFPVVIIPDFAADTRGDYGTLAKWDRRFGCVIRPPADEDPAPFAEMGVKLSTVAETIADWEEDLRIMYVACTRARDMLILSAGLKSSDIAEAGTVNSRMSALSERFDLHTGTCIAIDVDPLTVPEVRVRITPPTLDPGEEFVPPRAVEVWSGPARAASTDITLSPIVVPLIRLERGGIGALPTLEGDWQAAMRRFDDSTESLFSEVFAACDIADPDFTLPLMPMASDPRIAPLLRTFADSELRRRLVAANCIHRDVEVWLRGVDELPLLAGLIDLLFEDDAGAWHLAAVDCGNLRGCADPWKERKPGLLLCAAAVAEQLGRELQSIELLDLSRGKGHSLSGHSLKVAPAWKHIANLWEMRSSRRTSE